MVFRCPRSTVKNSHSMSPCSLTIFLDQVYQLYSCVLALYFKIILDYVRCSLWVLIIMDQSGISIVVSKQQNSQKQFIMNALYVETIKQSKSL